MNKKDLVEKIKKDFPELLKGSPPDLSDPKVYREFRRRCSESATPRLEAVDRHIKRSYEKSFFKVVRNNTNYPLAYST